MILVIDNYDSFTQNLVQHVGELGFEVIVVRNNQTSLNQIKLLKPSHIILSPGPGSPENTGISLNLIKYFADKIPILGVCLGHQAIAYAYGGKIKQLNQPVHGKVSQILHKHTDLFSKLKSPLLAARYHSLIVDKRYLPDELEITAWTHSGDIMGIRHKIHSSLRGIQFHPESLWTNSGKHIVRNFLLSK
uniref:Anthranilate synthase component 2 n=1 Tax=Rhodymenia pseudopalmata TaxID=31502 RepID=A0A1C9C7M7_RHOPU|nr:anthranilate synthase component 2 [Rhodymenia pseudopalmata]AOM64387.1 anthranilate synthase component 2 [Rhodymenia pseudopalmata]